MRQEQKVTFLLAPDVKDLLKVVERKLLRRRIFPAREFVLAFPNPEIQIVPSRKLLTGQRLQLPRRKG